MKRPINFGKIDNNDFLINGFSDDFCTQLDRFNEDAVWVFSSGKSLGDYCVRFIFHWDANQYDIRKCVLDQGTIGEDVELNLTLPIILCQKKDDFLNFISTNILHEIQKGTFKN